MRINVSTKLIVPTIAILASTAATITLVSSKYFEKSSSEREDTYNLASATAKGKEVENIIGSQYEKTKNIVNAYYKAQTTNTKESNDEFNSKWENNKDVISIEVIKLVGGSLEMVGRRTKEEVLKPFGLNLNYINQLRQMQRFPIRALTQGVTGSIELKNASGKNAPSMFTIGFPLIKDAQGRITHIALADIQLGVLQKPFSEPSEHIQYIVDRNGELLGHVDEQKAINAENASQWIMVKKALVAKSSRYQTKFWNPKSKSNLFGAAVKTSYGVTVISEISEDIILDPAREGRRKMIFITGISISVAIFIVFLLSMTLTSPIETLAQMIGLVSKGNFDVKARREVTANDEVGDLAQAFDEMTEGLKERDKVKNLFSKFHGSSVADDLMNNEIAVGGTNKDVVVFFSDIRGFTAFSEKRSPEEVVEMLNEYFGVMVSIINRNKGVVDKFIGDAIMAIWGAPKGSEQDASNALTACLQMRQELEMLNEKRIARGHPPINIGMGLHAGRAISGTIGSDERMEYTVIGNTVNTASRIEASTKAFGADLLVTHEVLEKCHDQFWVELAGSAEVKGRSDAIKMYKVKGFKKENGEMIEVKTVYSEYEAEKADKVKISA